MTFSSGVFLFIFLPVVLFLHTVIKNNRARNIFLIVASLVFYAFGEPVYIVMLLSSVAVNFFFGTILSRNKNKKILALAIVLNIGLLFVYKYVGFVVELLNNIPAVNLPEPDIAMPIGISFFTFQAISYVIDTYRSDKGERAGFFDVLLYISLFPQLIAGPIVKYNSVKERISFRQVTVDGLSSGIRLFIVGLSKKMLIANAMGSVADKAFAMDAMTLGTGFAWLGAICYTLQIYFDFSGYSDMAVGLGKALGFDFPQNFDHPYIAAGIRSFWRRWHMSLTGWFREYLYIPLGGNRKGRGRQLFNTMVVFCATGIWHGANLTFLFWGFMHGALMCLETLIFGKKESRLAPLKWIYTMFFVIIGFVIFRADDIAYGFSYIGRMFAFSSTVQSDIAMLSALTPLFIVTLVCALVACTPVVAKVGQSLKKFRGGVLVMVASYIISLGLLFLCIMTLAADSYNPFIYFRF